MGGTHPAKKNYKMDIYELFATDAKLETSGRWVSLGKDAKVLVARASNDRFTSRMKHLLKKHGVDLQDSSKENLDLLEKLVQDATAEAILLGWENLSFQGQALEYSKENALKLLAIKDFRNKISKLSDEMSGYLVAEQEAQGND